MTDSTMPPAAAVEAAAHYDDMFNKTLKTINGAQRNLLIDALCGEANDTLDRASSACGNSSAQTLLGLVEGLLKMVRVANGGYSSSKKVKAMPDEQGLVVAEVMAGYHEMIATVMRAMMSPGQQEVVDKVMAKVQTRVDAGEDREAVLREESKALAALNAPAADSGTENTDTENIGMYL